MLTIIVICIIGGLCAAGAVAFWCGVGEDVNNVLPALIFTLITILVVIVPIAGQHTRVLKLPLEISALQRTIDQQKELIAIDATLGQGLEGLEVKREIQSNIRELNDLIATAEYRTISPWWMFKPNMPDE